MNNRCTDYNNPTPPTHPPNSYKTCSTPGSAQKFNGEAKQGPSGMYINWFFLKGQNQRFDLCCKF